MIIENWRMADAIWMLAAKIRQKGQKKMDIYKVLEISILLAVVIGLTLSLILGISVFGLTPVLFLIGFLSLMFFLIRSIYRVNILRSVHRQKDNR